MSSDMIDTNVRSDYNVLWVLLVHAWYPRRLFRALDLLHFMQRKSAVRDGTTDLRVVATVEGTSA